MCGPVCALLDVLAAREAKLEETGVRSALAEAVARRRDRIAVEMAIGAQRYSARKDPLKGRERGTISVLWCARRKEGGSRDDRRKG